MRNRSISLVVVLIALFGIVEVASAAPKPPDMSVEGNTVTISDGDTSPGTGDHTDFGSVDTGSTFDRTYTIRNVGTGQLQLTGNPLVDIIGTHAADFTVTVQPITPVNKNGTTTFTVQFAPSAAGLRSATVSIANNHTDARNPYTFDIQGTGNVSLSAPTVTNTSFTSITADSASLRANVTSDGGAAITERGFAWNTSASPLTTDNKVSSAGPTPTDFTLTASSLPSATQIYARGYAINSQGTGYASSDMIFYTEPGSPATSVTFPVTGADSMTVNWNRGGGTGVIVLIKENSAVNSNPVDGVDTYTASSNFSSPGTEIGTGNYALYIGTGTSVAVTNLTAGSIYHIAVYEYAGTGSGLSGINYLQTGAPTNSQQIVGPPSATTVSASSIGSTTATFNITVASDGGGTINPHGTMWNTTGPPITQNQTDLGTYSGGVPGSFNDSVSGLPQASLIYFRGYVDNGNGLDYSDDGTFYTEPATQASAVTFSNATESSMQIDWTRGTGAGVIVLVKKDAAVDSSPVDGSVYTADSDYTGSGSTIGTGNYVLYIGTGTSVTVTNLQAGGTYHIAVYEYAGSGSGPSGINYLQTSPAINDQLIAGPPTVTTVISSSVDQNSATVNITVLSTGGSPITQHGTMWNDTGLPIIENPTTLGPFASVPGSFNDSLTSLPASSLIYFRGYATNVKGTDYSDNGTFYTEPSTQASAIIFPSATESSTQIDWTRGNGTGVIVIVKEGSTPDATPADGTVYTASTLFAAAPAEIGTSNYVAYYGSGTSVNLTGLTSGVTYYVTVYEYMGTGTGPDGVNYRLSSAPTNNKKIIGYPAISTPAVLTMPTQTNADLQATINNDGGDPITQRGFVWNTTGSPTLSDSKVTQNGSWAVSSSTLYSLATGSVLTPATKYYFRGFVTNPFGTSYTSDSLFYTEPSTQASTMTSPHKTYEEITVSWTPGNGDGALVIVRQGSAVTADPVDGTVYTAQREYGNPITEIGIGNYIIYAGDQTRAVAISLASTTNYHFAVYEYKGNGSGNEGINYKLTPLRGNFTTNDPPVGHNQENDIGCSVCHSLHSALVPRDALQIETCIDICHYPTGPAGSMSDVAVHANGHADCGSCHQTHAGIRAETDLLAIDTHVGGLTANNVKLIRANTGMYQPNALEDAIYHASADANDFLAFGTYTPLPPANRQVAPWTGVCQTCHTSTSHHTNDNSGDHNHPDAATNPDGKGCLECHPHSAGFAPTISEDTECLSASCHGDVAGTRRNILSELDVGSHHLSGTSSATWTQADEADCKVCHMEPEIGHMNGDIDLRDPDTGLAITGFVNLTRNSGSDVLEADVLNVQNNFCMKCHDSDGASSTASQNPAGGGAFQPFANAGTVSNVYDQFNPAFPSHHAVRGPGNNPFCNSTTMVAPWNQGDHDMISCFDCHMANGHGSNNNYNLVSPITGISDKAGIEAFCGACHNAGSYLTGNSGTNFADHTRGQHPANAYACRGCHAGQIDEDKDTGSDNGSAYPQPRIHGTNWTWPSDSRTPNIPQDSFLFGGWLGGVNVASPTCYAGNCSHTTSSKSW